MKDNLTDRVCTIGNANRIDLAYPTLRATNNDSCPRIRLILMIRVGLENIEYLNDSIRIRVFGFGSSRIFQYHPLLRHISLIDISLIAPFMRPQK